jgi:hypothetical protein
VPGFVGFMAGSVARPVALVVTEPSRTKEPPTLICTATFVDAGKPGTLSRTMVPCFVDAVGALPAVAAAGATLVGRMLVACAADGRTTPAPAGPMKVTVATVVVTLGVTGAVGTMGGATGATTTTGAGAEPPPPVSAESLDVLALPPPPPPPPVGGADATGVTATLADGVPAPEPLVAMMST